MSTASSRPAVVLGAVAILLAFAAYGICYADDGWVDGRGGNVGLMPGGHPSIRMVSEVVKIDQLPKGHVTATFVFTNYGKRCTPRIGFPGYGGHPDLVGFRSWVDGKRISVQRIAGDKERKGQQFWYVKTVPFGALQTHIIKDEYFGGLGGAGDELSLFYYDLGTGASWRGTIGHGKIVVDASGLRNYGFPTFGSPGFKRTGRIATWQFSNLKPDVDDEIIFSWRPYYDDVTINGVKVSDWPVTRRWDDSVMRLCQRRCTELWLPMPVAAAWLGGKVTCDKYGFHIVAHGRSVRFRVGSNLLEPSVGKQVWLPYPVDVEGAVPQPSTGRYAHVRCFQMIGLIGLIRALGGTAHFDKDNISLIATLPGYNAPKGASRAGN